MRKPIIKDLYEYEVTKNEGEGIKGYGWHLDIYKNGEKVLSDGAYGSETMAEVSARNFFLLMEFDISTEDREANSEFLDEWKRRSKLSMPNIKCAIGEEEWDVYGYDVLGNEEDGFEVNEVFRWGSIILPENPTLEQVIDNLKRVGFLSDEATIESVREDGDDDVIYLDDASNNYPLCQLRRRYVVSDTEQEQKIREWQERWHRRGKSILEEKVVEAHGVML